MKSLADQLAGAGLVSAEDAAQVKHDQDRREEENTRWRNLMAKTADPKGTAPDEREELSPLGKAILGEIVPECINQMRQNPTANKADALASRLRVQASKMSRGHRHTAFYEAIRDLRQLENNLLKPGLTLKDRKNAVEAHKWSNLVPFLHKIR